MFAVLTILCMFVFVLQAGFGGGADPLDRLASLFGGRAMRENDIAFLDGKPITTPDLIMLQRQRQMANFFMIDAANRAADNFQKLGMAAMAGKDQLNPADPKGHTIYQTNARALQAYISPPQFLFLTGQRGFTRPAYFEHEFVEKPFSASKLVDFLVWKQMARKLGINLTDAAVNEELNRMLLGGLTSNISRTAEREAEARFPGTSLKEALRDELNVRLAKAAILGDPYPQMITARVPVAVTPYEFKEFFNDQRTELEVAFLPVRVEDYLNQVTTQPTEKELERLYDRHKDQEYDPTARPGEPGFRQPRRLQVQFIGGDPDSPYYRQKAQELATLQEGLRRLTAAAPIAPLAGVLPASTSVALPVVLDLPLVADYDMQRFVNLRLPSWSDGIRSPVRNSAIFQPAAIAGAIGQATAFPIVWPAFEAQSVAAEKAERLDIAIGTLLAPSPVAAAAVVAKLYPPETFHSFASVQHWLRARHLDELARAALAANLDTVRKQIDELRKAKKLAELDKLVAGLAVNFHLQTGKSSLRDLHKEPIGDDPGLRSLRDVYQRLPVLARTMLFRRNDPQLNFGSTVFSQPGRPTLHEIETWQGFTRGSKGNSFDIRPASGIDFEPTDPDPWRHAPYLYLVWKTDEQPSRVLPLTNPMVRQEVEKAWRWEEARKLAKKAAEELAKEAAELKGDLPKLRDFALRHKEELIEKELPRLAKQVKVEELRPEFPLRYRSPTIPESRIPEIGQAGESTFGFLMPPEPSYSRFMDKVLALKDQPLGSAVAVSNRPGSVYYVAVALKKIDPSQEEFLRAYKEATGTGDRRGDLFRLFMQTRATKYYEDFIKELRQEAKLKVNEDRLEAFDGGEDRY